MRFLLVEDNIQLAKAVSERLKLEGHVVDHASSLTMAAEFLKVTSYQLILLDIMLPDGDGRSFLKKQREKKNQTPVIILTARSEISDRIDLLDLGADDYMTKPFDFKELEARCRAVLRRQGGVSNNNLEISGTILNSLEGTLTTGKNKENLRNKELRLIEVFFLSPEKIFSKNHLMDRLFSFSDEVSENAIEVYVGRIRKKLINSNLYIETVRGLGYRLVIKNEETF